MLFQEVTSPPPVEEGNKERVGGRQRSGEEYSRQREQHVQRLCLEAWLTMLVKSKARVAGREGERDRVTAEGETGGEDTGQPVQGLGEGVRKSF